MSVVLSLCFLGDIMPSLPNPCLTWMTSVLFLVVIVTTGAREVWGASLKSDPLYWGSKPLPGPKGKPHPPHSAEMMQALQYIQFLSQIADPLVPDNRDQDRFLSSIFQHGAEEKEREEAVRGGEQDEDHTQQWLEAILKTLQQADEGQSQIPIKPKLPKYPWREDGGRRQYRKHQLMFEDEGKDDLGNPFKRTNENAEGQYMPQKVANVQSIFEELQQISGARLGYKRHNSDEVIEDDGGDGDDNLRVRKMALEDMTRTEENQKGGQEFTNFDYSEYEDEESHELHHNDVKADEEESSEQLNLFKRSKAENPDDITRLVDFYLLNMLEKTGQQEEKRGALKPKELSEEEKTEEPLLKIMQLSQKLSNIPTEEHLGLLLSENPKGTVRSPQFTLHHAESPSTMFTYQRPLDAPAQPPNSDDILSLLGFSDGIGNGKNDPNHVQLSKYHTTDDEHAKKIFNEPTHGFSDKRWATYEDSLDEDDIASFLASQGVTRDQRQEHTSPSHQDKEEQLVLSELEQAVQGYLDQMVKSPPERRQSDQEDKDDEVLMRILSLLNPEQDDSQNTMGEK
uniref:Secretogranin II n=1 Tax=Denticeps clupeoides TaxID=299321 RepID=A0AAY4EBM0_9TELE